TMNVTGHSLGGALAHLMSFAIIPNYEIRCRLVTTTGCPCIFSKHNDPPANTFVTNFRDSRDGVYILSATIYETIGDDFHFHGPMSMWSYCPFSVRAHSEEAYKWIH